MEWYEAAFDRLYPILYPHRNDDEAERAMETFAHLFGGPSPVLDLASGGGRYVDALKRRGVHVYGLDLSLYLLCLSAARPGHRGRLVQADMRHLPFHGETFGAVLNMFTSFGYFSVDTDNLLVFREVQRVLKRGGVFLFDFLNADRIALDLLGHTSRRVGEYHVDEKRSIEGHGKYLVKRATVVHSETGRRDDIEERLRLYSRSDLVTMMNSVALEPADIFGDYRGNAFVPGVSERVVIVARKW